MKASFQPSTVTIVMHPQHTHITFKLRELIY